MLPQRDQDPAADAVQDPDLQGLRRRLLGHGRPGCWKRGSYDPFWSHHSGRNFSGMALALARVGYIKTYLCLLVGLNDIISYF